MNQKIYWLRGMGLGLIVYIAIIIILLALFYMGLISCNEFITVGPGVEQSVLCQPLIFLLVMPVMIFSELMEDISSGVLTNPGLYLGLLGSVTIYFGLWAIIGTLYGKCKNNL